MELATCAPTCTYVLDEAGKALRYRRCASVGLRYSAAFECVERVRWFADRSFAVDVRPESVAALMDAPLQAVCALHALRGATFVPVGVERCELLDAARAPAFAVATGRLTAATDAALASYYDMMSDALMPPDDLYKAAPYGYGANTSGPRVGFEHYSYLANNSGAYLLNLADIGRDARGCAHVVEQPQRAVPARLRLLVQSGQSSF